MKKTLFYSCLSCVLAHWGCQSNKVSLSDDEQNQLIMATIKIEKDLSMGSINAAKYGSYYLLQDQFHDSIFVDSTMMYVIDNTSAAQEIKRQYRKLLGENNKLRSDSFNLIHLIEYSNKSPVFLSVSKPIKSSKYYLINFFFGSWSSGYNSALLFKKSASGQFQLVYRRMYRVV